MKLDNNLYIIVSFTNKSQAKIEALYRETVSLWRSTKTQNMRIYVHQITKLKNIKDINTQTKTISEQDYTDYTIHFQDLAKEGLFLEDLLHGKVHTHYNFSLKKSSPADERTIKTLFSILNEDYQWNNPIAILLSFY